MKEVPVAKRVPQFFLQYSLTKARPQTACVGRTLRSLDRVAPLHAEDQVTRSFLFAEFKTGVCRRARCRHAVTVVALRDETATAGTIALQVPEWPGHVAGQRVDLRVTAADGNSPVREYLQTFQLSHLSTAVPAMGSP